MTNYRNGAKKEYRIMKQLARLHGFVDTRDLNSSDEFLLIRSAGSHTKTDIVFIDSKRKIIKLIQSKLGYLAPGEKAKIESLAPKLNGTYELFFELWD